MSKHLDLAPGRWCGCPGRIDSSMAYRQSWVSIVDTLACVCVLLLPLHVRVYVCVCVFKIVGSIKDSFYSLPIHKRVKHVYIPGLSIEAHGTIQTPNDLFMYK